MEITIDNKKMWESLRNSIWHFPQEEWLIRCIDNALWDQGLEYNPETKEIESIVPKPEYYKCIKEYRGFTVGKIYKTDEFGNLGGDDIKHNGVIVIENPYFMEWFRPAAPEEIPHSESDQEELSELEKAVLDIIPDHNTHTDSVEEFARRNAKRILSVARKQLRPEIDAEIDKAYKNQDVVQYKRGYNKAVEDAFDWLYKLYDKQGYLDIADFNDMKEAIKGE